MYIDGDAPKPHNYIFPNVQEKQKLIDILLILKCDSILDKMRFQKTSNYSICMKFDTLCYVILNTQICKKNHF